MTTFTPSVNFDLSSQKQNAGFEALTVTDPIVFKDVNLAIKEASTTNKGILNTGIQTINGVKTFVELPICDKIADANTQLVNKGYVDQAVKMGLTWKRPIKGFWDFNSLPSPFVIGDRYIATTNVAELTTKDYIYEYLGDDNLREIVPVEGMTLYNDANTGQFANQAITFDGTAWVNIGNVITYASLIGKPNQDLNTTNDVTFNQINAKNIISLEHATTDKQAILMTRNSTAKTVSIALQSDPSNEADGDFALINNENGALSITATNNLNLASNDGIVSCSNQLTTGSLKINATTPIINSINTTVNVTPNDTTLLTEKAITDYVGTQATKDHSTLSNLAIGDPHTQYALVAGRLNETVNAHAIKIGSTGQTVDTINNSVNVTPNDTTLLTEKAITDYVGTKASTDHSVLSNLTIGDPHTQYATVAGRANETITPHAITTKSINIVNSNTTDNVIKFSGIDLFRTDNSGDTRYVKSEMDNVTFYQLGSNNIGGIITNSQIHQPWTYRTGDSNLQVALQRNASTCHQNIVIGSGSDDIDLIPVGGGGNTGLFDGCRFHINHTGSGIARVLKTFNPPSSVIAKDLYGNDIEIQGPCMFSLMAVNIGAGIYNIDYGGGQPVTKTSNVTFGSLSLQPSATDTNAVYVRGIDTNLALSVNASTKRTLMESASILDYLTVQSYAQARSFHSKLTKVYSAELFVLRTTHQKIYIDVENHDLYLPVHIPDMEGYTWEITCSPNVVSCAIHVQKTGDHKPLSIGGANVVLYANQKIKVTLMDIDNDGYGVWQVSVKPTWIHQPQILNMSKSFGFNVTSGTYANVDNDVHLTCPPGRWNIRLLTGIFANNASGGNVALAIRTGTSPSWTFSVIPETEVNIWMGITINSGSGQTQGITYQAVLECNVNISQTTTYALVARRTGGATLQVENTLPSRLNFNAYRLR
jgi:hypothetical protein